MKDDDRIRFIFGERRNFSRASAAAAFGRSVVWLEKNRFSRENGDVVEWEEMVLLGYARWTHLEIHHALGDEAPKVFPPLQLLSPLTIHLPLIEVIAARDQARRRHMDVSGLLADFFSPNSDEAKRLDREYPGYWEAWRFPYLK